MKILKIKTFKILLDNEDFDFLKNQMVWVEKCRDSHLVRLKINGGRVLLNRFLLNKPKNRVKHKNNNPFDFQRKNLILTDKDHATILKIKYYKKHRKKHLARAKKWYKANREICLKRSALFRVSPEGRQSVKKNLRTFRTRHLKSKLAAKKRGLTFKISYKKHIELLNKLCYYCNISLLPESGVGLDRIDNNLGYIETNVLPCCGICNKTRAHRWTVEETKVMITAALNYRKSK